MTDVTDVQGHRGCRGLLPENTLPAFRRALELDLGVSADGVVVVSHDRWIDPAKCLDVQGRRLPGERGPLLKDLSLEEIRAYDCGSLNPDPRSFPEPPREHRPGAWIPTLQEVFDLVEAQGDQVTRFNVETKVLPSAPGGEPETVPLESFAAAVVEVVAANGLEERVTVQSFDWRVLELVRNRSPGIETSALLARDTLRRFRGRPSPWLNGIDPATLGSGRRGRRPVALLEAAREYVDVFSPHWRLVVPRSGAFLGSSVAEIQVAGFPVLPWTVNRRREMEQLLALGVDGLISDYPDRLREVVEARGGTVRRDPEPPSRGRAA